MTSCATKPRWTTRAPTPRPGREAGTCVGAQDNEPFDYLCQENNRDPVRMTGGGVADSNRAR